MTDEKQKAFFGISENATWADLNTEQRLLVGILTAIISVLVVGPIIFADAQS